MTSELPALAGALAFGLFGSLHCVGMCGGIVAALGQAGADRSHGPGAIAADAIPYHVGRITSYALAGAGAGAMGAAFSEGVGGGFAVRVAAGLLLMAGGAYVAGWWMGLGRLERVLTPLWRRISPLTKRLLPADTVPRRLALGALWGWLPCGLVLSALALAAASGGPGQGALTMAAFGLGTAPSLLAVGAFGRFVGGLGRRISVRRGAGVALCVFGLWTIGGPWLMQSLHGADHAGHHGPGVTNEAPLGNAAHVHDHGGDHGGDPGGDPAPVESSPPPHHHP